MSTLRTNTLQTLDSAVTVDVGDLVVDADLLLINKAVTSVAALRTVSKLLNSYIATLGYYAVGDGGSGNYRYDSTDITSVDNGGTVIVGDDGGRWKLVQRGPVSAKQFGVKADVFDVGTYTANNTALQAARDWVAANATRNALVFPSGVYAYSISPNWAIQNASVTSEGEVRFRYFGTGNAVIIDLGPTLSTFLFNVTMGPFLVEAPSTAQNGVYVRSIHHSKLQFKVRGAGTNFAGMKVEFAVCTDFGGSTCYPNDDGNWYLNAKPKYGLWLDKRNVGEQVSYSNFLNTIWEGLDQVGGAGILCDGTLGNSFNGGTSERCDFGVITTANAINNRFYGMDFEANLTRDIFEQGLGNEYHGVDSMTSVVVVNGALFPKFFGGSFEGIEIAAGARWPLFEGCNVNRFSTVGGGFTNGEPTSMFRDCIDLQTQKITPLIQGAVTVGSSPYNYVNLTGNDQMVSVSGGTISTIIYSRAGVDVTLPSTAGVFHVTPGDTLRVTYTVLPNMYFWQK